jgi:hypothetical protein
MTPKLLIFQMLALSKMVCSSMLQQVALRFTMPAWDSLDIATPAIQPI